MNIPITPEEEPIEPLECCVFCNVKTINWHIEKNRPVCEVCSRLNSPEDINNAPYNY